MSAVKEINDYFVKDKVCLLTSVPFILNSNAKTTCRASNKLEIDVI